MHSITNVVAASELTSASVLPFASALSYAKPGVFLNTQESRCRNSRSVLPPPLWPGLSRLRLSDNGPNINLCLQCPFFPGRGSALPLSSERHGSGAACASPAGERRYGAASAIMGAATTVFWTPWRSLGIWSKRQPTFCLSLRDTWRPPLELVSPAPYGTALQGSSASSAAAPAPSVIPPRSASSTAATTFPFPLSPGVTVRVYHGEPKPWWRVLLGWVLLLCNDSFPVEVCGSASDCVQPKLRHRVAVNA